jgi:hypothetical protein
MMLTISDIFIFNVSYFIYVTLYYFISLIEGVTFVIFYSWSSSEVH